MHGGACVSRYFRLLRKLPVLLFTGSFSVVHSREQETWRCAYLREEEVRCLCGMPQPRSGAGGRPDTYIFTENGFPGIKTADFAAEKISNTLDERGIIN